MPALKNAWTVVIIFYVQESFLFSKFLNQVIIFFCRGEVILVFLFIENGFFFSHNTL